MKSFKETIAILGLAILLFTPACISQQQNPTDENTPEATEARTIYQLTGSQLGELFDAWHTLLEFESTLGERGYTLMPECFHHVRYNVPSGELITFIARNPSPTGCSPFGSFRLNRPQGENEWKCSVKISNSSTLPCDLSE